jgi:hypothetical protein
VLDIVLVGGGGGSKVGRRMQNVSPCRMQRVGGGGGGEAIPHVGVDDDVCIVMTSYAKLVPVDVKLTLVPTR